MLVPSPLRSALSVVRSFWAVARPLTFRSIVMAVILRLRSSVSAVVVSSFSFSLTSCY